MNRVKSFLMGAAGALTLLVVVAGVAWAADIFMVDQNGAVYLRIASSGNVGIGTTTDAGSRLEVRGSGTTSATSALNVTASNGTSRLFVRDDGNVGIGTTSPSQKVDIAVVSVGDGLYIRSTGTNSPGMRFENEDLTQVGAVGLALGGGHWSSDAATGDMVVRSKNGKVILATGTGPSSRLAVNNAGNIGIGTTSPATSAMLDVSSTTGAILIPRMTTAQRNALTAANGMIVYNTSTNAFNFYENGAWATK